MSEVARGTVKARPIPIGKRVVTNSEKDYIVRNLRIKASIAMAADAQDVVARISSMPGYDDVTKVNVINMLTNYGRNVR